MRIVVFEIETWEKEFFQTLNNHHAVECVSAPLTSDNAHLYADADSISTFIYSDLASEVLRQFSRLKLIATRSTGYDHIDLNWCQEHDITVSHVPNYGQNTVAEHVFGLLLAISHHLTEAIDRTRKGDFSLEGLQGFDLCGKTLGVIGTGAIGRCVIGIAKGFGMKVVAYDTQPDENLASQPHFHYLGFEDLLSQADLLTIHVPATQSTYHLISDPQFKQMKEGVILINTSRGSVVDIQALVHALADGKVAAAGLDVLPEEPAIREEAELLRTFFRKSHDLETLLADHILLRLRNVIVTPHSAFFTREAVGRILDTTVKNIAAFHQGRPQHVVGA